MKQTKSHTAIESEAYAIPYLWQTSGAPNGLPFSLQTAGMIIRGKFPIFPVHNNQKHELFKPKVHLVGRDWGGQCQSQRWHNYLAIMAMFENDEYTFKGLSVATCCAATQYEALQMSGRSCDFHQYPS